MKELLYTVIYTAFFEQWFWEQSGKMRAQIESRLILIQTHGHFGDHKPIDKQHNIWELRWKNGRRIYFGHLDKKKIVLLIGGNKNGQDKDIRKARSIISNEAFC